MLILSNQVNNVNQVNIVKSRSQPISWDTILEFASSV